MNAVKHNLSGQNLILQETELEAYNRMAASMFQDLNPKSEPERQIAQKIVDLNFRLNRLTAIENNLFSFGLTANETDTDHDDRIEVMAAQTRAWTERASYFDTLGRYEQRLSRQLLKYQEEFERLQAARKDQEFIERRQSAEEIERDEEHRRESVVRPENPFDPASFHQVENSYRILSHLPHQKVPKTSPNPPTPPTHVSPVILSPAILIKIPKLTWRHDVATTRTLPSYRTSVGHAGRTPLRSSPKFAVHHLKDRCGGQSIQYGLMNTLSTSRTSPEPGSPSRGLPSFLQASILLVAAPLWILCWVTFQTSGWSAGLAVVPRWLGLCLLFWWPIGAFLSLKRGWTGRIWLRLLVGYLISVPLFFVSLYVVYPAFGAAFHPMVNGQWKIYLSATPQFYLMVLLVSWLTSLRIAPWIVRGSALVFAAGAFLPFYLSATSSFDWPTARLDHLVIEGSRIVDAGSNRIVDGQSVYISNGRITEISAGSSHPDWPRIQADGHYLLPGLIDVHTHLQSPVEVRTGFQLPYFLKSTISNYAPQRRAYLESGVTTVRDLGGPALKSFRMRTEIDRKEMLGPRLLTSGRLVTSRMGHPVSTIWSSEVSNTGAILATNEKTMIDGLDRNLAEGPPDVVKFIHGTIGRAKEELSADLMARGIRWAKDHGLTSVVHAETPAEFEDAIRAGATGVEHAAYLDSLPPSLLTLVSANRPFIDPTFGEYETSNVLQKVPQSERARKLKKSYGVVRELARSGARIVIGTDAPLVAYGSGFHDEIAQFLCAGFTPSEILAMATSGNAAYIGKAAELGRIAAGFRADLILAKDNPLENPTTLRKPLWTMLDGQVVASNKQ